MILKLWPPQLHDNKCLLFKPQMGSFVTATWETNQLPTPEMATLHLNVIFPEKKLLGDGGRQESEAGREVTGYNTDRAFGRQELHLSIT